MKKILLPVLAMFLLAALLFISCNKTIAGNSIKAMTLTKEQSELIELLSVDGKQYALFEYELGEGFTQAEFWIEIYQDGILKETIEGLSFYSDDADLNNGNLAVIIDKTPDFCWAFIQEIDGVKTIRTTDGEYGSYSETLNRAYGSISSPVSIQKGKDIILHSTFFSNASIAFHNDQQIYLEEPELLQQYPYVHLMKCRFE